MSQEQLAARAEVSTRHLSFVENGRSAPSRTMVLVLANALDLPLRDRNLLLQGGLKTDVAYLQLIRARHEHSYDKQPIVVGH